MLATEKTRIEVTDGGLQEQIGYRIGFNGYFGEDVLYRSEDKEHWCLDFTNASIDNGGSCRGRIDGTWKIQKSCYIVVRALILDAKDESELPTREHFEGEYDDWDSFEEEGSFDDEYNMKGKEWNRKFLRYQ